MKNHKLRFWNSSIFTQISLLTAIVVMIISIISTSFLTNGFSTRLQNRDRLLVQEAANKIHLFFQDNYNAMFNQRTLVHSAGHISDIIVNTRENPSTIYKHENLQKITDYLTALTYSNADIEDVILFTADGKNNFSYSAKRGRSVYLGYDFTTLPYIQEFQDSSAVITEIYDAVPAYLTYSSSKRATPTLSFIMKIYDRYNPSSQETIGYMMVNYSSRTVDATYEEIKETADGDYFVLNDQEKVIYSNNTSKLNKSFSADWLQENEIISRKPVSLSGIEIISSLANHKLKQTANQLLWNSALVTGAGILLMIIVILFLHRHYARKFQQLALAMDKISTGNFSIELPVKNNDEIGYLSQTFNQMSRTLNEYIDKTFLAETQRRTSELYALQAQINPHFLANTIESIRMKALENDDYDSSVMLEDLGNLFRWMIQFDQDIIYIEDEMEYINTYLELQSFRFQDRMSVSIELPSDLYYYGIPRFTLQPIIENALSHGSPNMHALLITVKFSLENETLKITVQDNGPGLSEEKLDRLNRHITGTQTDSEFGVALRNIHTRITLLFGKQYGLKVESRPSRGTTVTVTLPAKKKK